MKKFFIKLFVFVALLYGADIFAGRCFDYLAEHSKGGDTARHNYINLGTTEDMLIMGSSRAFHHYDPTILEDSLGMSVYNCGQNANGILLCYMQLCNILERYQPKVIIYDVMPSYDCYKEPDNAKYLAWERRFYGKPEIDSVFWDINPYERYKMHSNLYRHNSKFLFLITDFINPFHGYAKGYSPIDGVMDYDLVEDSQEKDAEVVDSLKVKYLDKFIQKCRSKHVCLVFTVSPLYKQKPDNFQPVKAIADKYGIPFISHYQDSIFVGHKEFFSDASHMNRVGAEKYTKLIAADLELLFSSLEVR
jgi:hypothetical protein